MEVLYSRCIISHTKLSLPFLEAVVVVSVTVQKKTTSLQWCQILRTILHVECVDNVWHSAAQLMEHFSVHAIIYPVLVNCLWGGADTMLQPAKGQARRTEGFHSWVWSPASHSGTAECCSWLLHLGREPQTITLRQNI